jgi:hypothetical protein
MLELEQELKYFQSIKDELLSRNLEGQFALIKGTELFGTYASSESAYAEGVARFGRQPFLIKQILRVEGTERVPILTAGIFNARL